jgi:nitronate monooxygenase
MTENYWPNVRILKLLGIQFPIIQAPMANFAFADLAIAVSNAGGLGSLACASLAQDRLFREVTEFRHKAKGPLNLNYFCHFRPPPDPQAEMRWRHRLWPYYIELGVAEDASAGATGRDPFDDVACINVEKLRPEVVSFHFGLPEKKLLERVKATGAKILSSATTVEEAVWLEANGCDVIIAQGLEAGGHRGNFFHDDIASQVGTMALVPQVVDAVKVPVIAAGGIADGRGIAAAFALGASAVQLGTAYLLCDEAQLSVPHRSAFREARDDSTVITNVFTGRPARGFRNRLVREVGPMNADAPPFPEAAKALAPLRAKAEAVGSGDFSPMWAGQAAHLTRSGSASGLTRCLVNEAQECLKHLRAL